MVSIKFSDESLFTIMVGHPVPAKKDRTIISIETTSSDLWSAVVFLDALNKEQILITMPKSTAKSHTWKNEAAEILYQWLILKSKILPEKDELY